MHTKTTRFPLAVLLVFVGIGLVGCDSDPASDDGFPDPETVLVEDLAADPFVGVDAMGRPVGTGQFTFYSLRENREVPASDSASTAWDVAFRGTTILINGGTSGPGAGAAQVMEGVFEAMTEAPADGWQQDGANGPAIPAGSEQGWYNYNPAAMVVTPIPGRVLLIRTADGRYAKIRILSYYQGAPETPTFESEARYYTFEYVFQPDGSRSLEV